MKNFTTHVTETNYKKRFIFIVISAVALAVLSIALVVAFCHTQISELIAFEKAEEQSEKIAESQPQETVQTTVIDEDNELDDGEHEHEIFDQLTPVSTSAKVIFVLLAMLWFALGVFYWISVIEWLYKAAVQNELNRALWPILGAAFNLFAMLALLIVINDPKRVARKV